MEESSANGVDEDDEIKLNVPSVGIVEVTIVDVRVAVGSSVDIGVDENSVAVSSEELLERDKSDVSNGDEFSPVAPNELISVGKGDSSVVLSLEKLDTSVAVSMAGDVSVVPSVKMVEPDAMLIVVVDESGKVN